MQSTAKKSGQRAASPPQGTRNAVCLAIASQMVNLPPYMWDRSINRMADSAKKGRAIR